MILPTKHLNQNRALLTIGAQILKCLDKPKTVSAIWEEFRKTIITTGAPPPISYEWFILALDLLYAIDAIKLYHGLISRESR